MSRNGRKSETKGITLTVRNWHKRKFRQQNKKIKVESKKNKVKQRKRYQKPKVKHRKEKRCPKNERINNDFYIL